MQIVLRVGQLCIVVASVYLLATSVLRGIREGKFHARGGMIIERRRQPVQFWFSVVAMLASACLIGWVYVNSFGHPLFMK